jgi:small-conductance mechanosensitive channel
VSIALLSSLAWAVGGGIAWLLTSENWYYLYSYFQDYTGPSYLLESEEMVGILGLALIGVLSALLGFLTLYLLSRYWPQNSPPS